MQGFVCRIRSLNGVPCPFLISVAAKMNGPPAAVVAATTSAADTNFLCGNREWFRLQRLLRQRGPRPILFFVAAEKNGSACSGCRDNDLPRPNLIFVAAKKNGPPAAAVAATIFRI